MKTITRWGLAFDIGVSLIVLLALVSPAGAEVEVYSTDFEQTEGYTLGDLRGQLGWDADEDTGDCVVQSSDRSSGSWAVRVTADGDYDGGFHAGAEQSFTYPSKTCNKLIVTLDTKITASNEADYLVALARKSTSEIVTYVHFQWTRGISVNGAATGSNWTANTWIPLRLELDFQRQVADVFYGGQQVADDVAFAGTDPVDEIFIVTDDYVGSGSSMLFDNLRITARGNPIISAITPTSGPKLTYLKIEGQDFGSSAGSVQFAGGAGTVVSWSDTLIYCRAPAGVATGGVFVRTASGLDSGSATFTVTVPSIIHVNNTTNIFGIENGTTTYPFSTVQRGIDAASDGAEVVVAQGTYVENINFNGKAITVRSTNPDDPVVVAATILDGNQAGSVVAFSSGEGLDSVLTGFTIQNGQASLGGGISCYSSSSPTIRNNTISGNSASSGGGIVCRSSSSPRIQNNTISGNSASYRGGGIDCYSSSSPTIQNNTISGNSADYYGGGIVCWYLSSPTIQDNTITGNSAEWNGGGIYCEGSSPLIENNLIRDNVAENEYGWGTGGGISCTNWGGESTPTIRGNIIENNLAQGAGGGIHCEGWEYECGSWESEGWTTVYQDNVTITDTGWVTFDFQTPFDYNGTDNLLVDFSYNNDWNDWSLWGEPGWCLASAPGGLRTIWYSGWADDPLTWPGNSPTPLPSDLVPDVRLGGDSAVTVGTGTGQSEFPFYIIDAPSTRTQVIYLASEIGGARRISSLALNVAQVPGAPLTRWTIRVKHTSLAAYPVSFATRPVITENLIRDNTVENEWGCGYGAGIYCRGTAARIENNMIGCNRVGGPWGAGGGISCENGASVIRNNLIWGNEIIAEYGMGGVGGGVYCSDLAPQPIENNTVVNNATGGGWGGLGNGIACSPGQTITNCIVWGNPAEGGSLVAGGGNFSISYSNIQGGEDAVSGAEWGPGNIDVDPFFADPAADDYHLKSQAGRWDPVAGGGAGDWVTDSVTSPCIDAGDPVSDYGNEPSPNGGRINMGAYGNTAFASKSVPAPVLASVLPDSGPHYTLMKITGSWFGFAEGTVEVADTPLTILAWSDTEIRCEVPPEATSGPLVVRRLNGVESNPLAFAVTNPTILYVDDDNTSGIENGTLTWPFSTVQRAIRAATAGDTVQVAAGTYRENIDFLGKAITVQSANPDDPAVVAGTILDGNHSGSVVTFNTQEGLDSVLSGFTIRNGSGTDYCGAGVHCHGSSPTVEKNVITGNTALAHGGGIYCSGGSPTIRDNRVEGNEARWFGGGIALWNSTATVTGNLIRDNAAHWYGGGLLVHGPAAPTVRNNVFSGNTGSEGAGIACLYKCSPLLENNTLTGNTAERYGGAVFGGWECSPVVRNTIAWANSAPEGPELAFWDSCQPTVSYSDVQGGQAPVYLGTDCSLTWGSGNLNLDPLMDASGYCHLKSTGGRYDRGAGLLPESAGAWVLDGVTSPCIDAGDPLSAYAAELLPNGDRINMGAWGNTAYASKPAGAGGLAVGVAQDDDAGTTVPPPVVVGASPCLESTNPALGGSLAGRTTLTLTFDRPVTVGAGAAEVYGETTGAHADYSVTSDDGKRTVRLEWASPLPADAYEVRVIAEFVLDDETGFPLDGEVQDPADPESLPSGDGKPGGDAHLEFGVE